MVKVRWSLYVPHSGHFMYRTLVTMYRQFNIQQFNALPPQLYLHVFCGSRNKQPLFPYTELTNWFLQPRGSVYCAVGTKYLHIIQSLERGRHTFMSTPNKSCCTPVRCSVKSLCITCWSLWHWRRIEHGVSDDIEAVALVGGAVIPDAGGRR